MTTANLSAAAVDRVDLEARCFACEQSSTLEDRGEVRGDVCLIHIARSLLKAMVSSSVPEVQIGFHGTKLVRKRNNRWCVCYLSLYL